MMDDDAVFEPVVGDSTASAVPTVHSYGNMVIFDAPPQGCTVSFQIRFWTEADWVATADALRPEPYRKIPGGYVSWMMLTRDPRDEHVLLPPAEWPRGSDDF